MQCQIYCWLPGPVSDPKRGQRGSLPQKEIFPGLWFVTSVSLPIPSPCRGQECLCSPTEERLPSRFWSSGLESGSPLGEWSGELPLFNSFWLTESVCRGAVSPPSGSGDSLPQFFILRSKNSLYLGSLWVVVPSEGAKVGPLVHPHPWQHLDGFALLLYWFQCWERGQHSPQPPEGSCVDIFFPWWPSHLEMPNYYGWIPWGWKGFMWIPEGHVHGASHLA